MLFLLISAVPFLLLLSKSLPLKPLPPWTSDVRLLFFVFVRQVQLLSVVSLSHWRSITVKVLELASSISPMKKSTSRVENVEDSVGISLLDLPELALDCILGRLSPAELCNMIGVCRSLRDICRSDYMWKRHMKEKWGRVIGARAKREWHKCLAARMEQMAAVQTKPRWLFGFLSHVYPLLWLKNKLCSRRKLKIIVPDDSLMLWYLYLEKGKFCFPAQVYNREGHVGFVLSCYDAELTYDSNTDTFCARYPPHGQRTVVVEEAVQWDRIRSPPLDTSPHDLHISNCLYDLHPGDHIEIQWRRNKEFPYGWWYGRVGHLVSCDGNEHFCRCENSETILLEFNHYTPGSRWRQAIVSRKHHREEGNEEDGFYGGIRKLYTNDEISTWRQLWPSHILE
ncbi:hypothetical protein HPP92_000872 [Vanilla planifolia]|uniref:F-box domain-containing protein n=1 Tax=Vanilla planifolia TaxID=51239 RepID=A0A835S3E3_VANPL|nr:hypothetical protein HPP92_001028 [Vanilla planifolia]KAG0500800.1 hypothetical protein HPP92_000872 [Vanilla planifolia]